MLQSNQREKVGYTGSWMKLTRSSSELPVKTVAVTNAVIGPRKLLAAMDRVSTDQAETDLTLKLWHPLSPVAVFACIP